LKTLTFCVSRARTFCVWIRVVVCSTFLFVCVAATLPQSEFRAPFLVFPSVSVDESGSSGGYKVDVTVRVRADLPPQCYGTNVQVRVPLPRTAQVTSCIWLREEEERVQ
jgi:hypothetical protein